MFTVTLTSAAGPSRAVYVSATAAIESGVVSLAAAVGAGDVAGTRFWLATLGMNALGAQSRDEPPVPLVIVAATAGFADVLSVLITFGMDPNARHPDLQTYYGHTVPFLMADFENGLTLSRTQRLEVIRHFGDAVSAKSANYNWNAADGSGYYLPNLLNFSEAAGADAGEVRVLLDTADYMLSQGMNCKHLSETANRYHKYCVGGLGGVLVSLITMTVAVSDDDVRAAAQGMVDAGIPLEAAGDAANGHLVAVAAFNRHAGAVSILLTFGMDAFGRRMTDTALHVVASESDSHPAAMLAVLRGYVGGLSVAGDLDSFNGWNVLSFSDSPMDLLQRFASRSASGPADKLEIHSVFYERGARCTASTTGDYCEVPAEDFALAEVQRCGGVFHIDGAGGFGVSVAADCGGGFGDIGGERMGVCA